MDDTIMSLILDDEEAHILEVPFSWAPAAVPLNVVTTNDPPSMDTIEEWTWEGYCEATDGCIVEPDGTCEHGHPSWLIELGLI